jgi:hypothetical protein
MRRKPANPSSNLFALGYVLSPIHQSLCTVSAHVHCGMFSDRFRCHSNALNRSLFSAVCLSVLVCHGGAPLPGLFLHAYPL